MQSVKVSDKYQITLLAAVRRKLGIKRGDCLLVDVRGEHILLTPEPRDYAGKLEGLHADVWEGVDPREYVRREREARSD